MRKIGLMLLACITLMAGCSMPSTEIEEKITSLSQLSDKKITVLEDSPADNLVRERFPNASVKKEKTLLEAVSNLSKNKTDAVVYVDTVLNYAVEEGGVFSILPEPIEPFDYVLAVRNEDTELLKQVNVAIKKLIEDGTIDEMSGRWFQKAKTKDLIMPQIRQSAGEETIKIGVEAAMVPFSYKDSFENIIGFDVELAKRIGVIVGKKVEIKETPYLISKSSLEDRTVDLVVVGINDVNALKEYVSISQPYLKGAYSALVKN